MLITTKFVQSPLRIFASISIGVGVLVMITRVVLIIRNADDPLAMAVIPLSVGLAFLGVVVLWQRIHFGPGKRWIAFATTAWGSAPWLLMRRDKPSLDTARQVLPEADITESYFAATFVDGALVIWSDSRSPRRVGEISLDPDSNVEPGAFSYLGQQISAIVIRSNGMTVNLAPVIPRWRVLDSPTPEMIGDIARQVQEALHRSVASDGSRR